MIMLSLLVLFGYFYQENAKKDSSYDKASDNSISIPPILSDDSISLETSSLNDIGMLALAEMVFKNTMTGIGGSYSIQNMNAIATIKQIRKCINTDEFYNIYEIDKGRLYVFYAEEDYHIPYQIVFYCYAEKRLSFSDFNNIKTGKKSTIDDVRRIDESAGYPANACFSPQNYMDGSILPYDEDSFHMTKEGVVKIGYRSIDGQLYVASIKKNNEERISGINELDLP